MFLIIVQNNPALKRYRQKTNYLSINIYSCDTIVPLFGESVFPGTIVLQIHKVLSAITF
jgi:hypothetical protein